MSYLINYSPFLFRLDIDHPLSFKRIPFSQSSLFKIPLFLTVNFMGPPFFCKGTLDSIFIINHYKQIKKRTIVLFCGKNHLVGLLKVFKHLVHTFILFPANSLNFFELVSLGI
ncbi:MAG: hypothetical protein BWY03_00631 [Parcubacteria group bacterium ADurb.Bin159]|nr:MAG: hypothetical protein BWY03_00631 [Parcubacteria group bacterium ADurb.Bin159]